MCPWPTPQGSDWRQWQLPCCTCISTKSVAEFTLCLESLFNRWFRLLRKNIYSQKCGQWKWSPGCIFDSVWGWPCHSCQCAILWLMVLPTVGEGNSGGRERRPRALTQRVGWSVFSPYWLKRCLVFSVEILHRCTCRHRPPFIHSFIHLLIHIYLFPFCFFFLTLKLYFKINLPLNVCGRIVFLPFQSMEWF